MISGVDDRGGETLEYIQTAAMEPPPTLEMTVTALAQILERLDDASSCDSRAIDLVLFELESLGDAGEAVLAGAAHAMVARAAAQAERALVVWEQHYPTNTGPREVLELVRRGGLARRELEEHGDIREAIGGAWLVFLEPAACAAAWSAGSVARAAAHAAGHAVTRRGDARAVSQASVDAVEYASVALQEDRRAAGSRERRCQREDLRRLVAAQLAAGANEDPAASRRMQRLGVL